MEAKVIIISGPQACGKSMLAKIITNNKNVVFKTEKEFFSTFGLSDITDKTEAIVIDECYSMEAIKVISTSDKLFINKKGRPQEMIDLPLIIITTTLEVKHKFDFNRNILARRAFLFELKDVIQ